MLLAKLMEFRSLIPVFCVEICIDCDVRVKTCVVHDTWASIRCVYA